jgi:signal transduction histidine kinase
MVEADKHWQDRQRVLQDLHDGLGSRLFTTLARVERGQLGLPEVAQALRACVADLRLAFEVDGAPDATLASLVAGLRFRWQSLLQDAAVASHWQLQLADTLQLPASHSTQLLHVMQEALTNVLKHANASEVQVEVMADAQQLCLRVQDNGCGFAAPQPQLARPPQALPTEPAGSAPATGQGLRNMRLRAQRLGGQLVVHSAHGGTVVERPLPRLRRAAVMTHDARPARRSA